MRVLLPFAFFSFTFDWFTHERLLAFFGIVVFVLGILRIVVPEIWTVATKAVEAYYAFKRRLAQLRAGSS